MPIRPLLNTVYAWLAERADSVDHAHIAAGANPKEVDEMGLRASLDGYLSAPVGREAAGESALLAYFGAA